MLSRCSVQVVASISSSTRAILATVVVAATAIATPPVTGDYSLRGSGGRGRHRRWLGIVFFNQKRPLGKQQIHLLESRPVGGN